MLRRAVLVLVLAASCLAPFPQQQSVLAAPRHSEQTQDCVVYATRTGHRYHQPGCRYLRQSSIRMTREQAVQEGLTPCRVCGGSDCER